jgi:hypothetical protein
VTGDEESAVRHSEEPRVVTGDEESTVRHSEEPRVVTGDEESTVTRQPLISGHRSRHSRFQRSMSATFFALVQLLICFSRSMATRMSA